MKQVEIGVVDRIYIEKTMKRLAKEYDIDCNKFCDEKYVNQVVKAVMEKFQKYKNEQFHFAWVVQKRKHELKRICLPYWTDEQKEKEKMKKEGTFYNYIRNTIYLIFQNDAYFADDIWKDMYMLIKATLNRNAYSSTSEWTGYTGTRGIENLPFVVKNEHILNVSPRAMEVLLKTDNIRLFQFKKRKRQDEESEKNSDALEDITRYGYKKAMNMYLQIREASIDNSLLFDKMLGISLTNTLFVCICSQDYVDLKWGRKNIEKEFSEAYLEELYERGILCKDLKKETVYNDFLGIVRLLGKIEPLFIRNWVAQIIMYFLHDEIGDCETISKVKEILKQIVDDINICYQALLDICVCEAFKDIAEWTKEELLEYVLYYEECMKDNIDGYMDNQIVNNIMNLYYEVKSEEVDEIHIEQIPNTKERLIDKISSYTNMYAQIHRAVMEGYFRT